jgi:alpha,alpha-trehalase
MNSRPFYVELEALFVLAHNEHLFEDGKKWADAVPNKPLQDIKASFELWKAHEGEPLMQFIEKHFTFPQAPNSAFVADKERSVEDHIKSLWPYLKRQASVTEEGSSLIPLKYDYIVPGGRFNEIYYWDSYFTMIGLLYHGMVDEVVHMIDNFANFIDTYGFIPNGNRAYFLSRSQPPFFAMMVTLLDEHRPAANVLQQYLPQLVKEHDFWMGHGRGIAIGDGMLNRYWDDDPSPRMEMYLDDVHLATQAQDASNLYLNIKAACESGWDFSSRWFDGDDLLSIATTDILPVDLNCLLYHLELTIAKAYKNASEEMHARYITLAQKRKLLIEQFLYDEKNGCYGDYNFVKQSLTLKVTAAMMFPLFFGIADKQRAEATISLLNKELIKSGGVATTNVLSGQQWDAPNGWAPLQWISVMGLSRYDGIDTALQLAVSWLSLNESVFRQTGKMMEKYNVIDCDKEVGGGEYAVQDGFGWTNGVYIGLKRFVELYTNK